MAKDAAGSGRDKGKPSKRAPTAPPLRHQQYPVAQPYDPRRSAAPPPPVAQPYDPRRNAPPPPVALAVSAPPLPVQRNAAYDPGLGQEAPLPTWFKPLAKILALLTLAMACTLGGWLTLRGKKTPPPKNTGFAIAKVDSKGETKTEASPAEQPREETAKKSAKKEEPATPIAKTEPKDKPDAKTKPESKAKTEPDPKPEVKPEATPTPKPAPETPKTVTANVTFDKDVLPIFRAKCIACHGGDKKKAGLDVRSVAALLKGGDNGSALKPGSLEQSLLWETISTDQMPPGKNNKLTQAEKKIIQTWITQGKDIVK